MGPFSREHFRERGKVRMRVISKQPLYSTRLTVAVFDASGQRGAAKRSRVARAIAERGIHPEKLRIASGARTPVGFRPCSGIPSGITAYTTTTLSSWAPRSSTSTTAARSSPWLGRRPPITDRPTLVDQSENVVRRGAVGIKAPRGFRLREGVVLPSPFAKLKRIVLSQVQLDLWMLGLVGERHLDELRHLLPLLSFTRECASGPTRKWATMVQKLRYRHALFDTAEIRGGEKGL